MLETFTFSHFKRSLFCLFISLKQFMQLGRFYPTIKHIAKKYFFKRSKMFDYFKLVPTSKQHCNPKKTFIQID